VGTENPVEMRVPAVSPGKVYLIDPFITSVKKTTFFVAGKRTSYGYIDGFVAERSVAIVPALCCTFVRRESAAAALG
jgi:hypothetical protein